MNSLITSHLNSLIISHLNSLIISHLNSLTISHLNSLTISHLNSLTTKKTTIYEVGNPGPGLGQGHKCGRVKLAKGVTTYHHNNWISNVYTYISKNMDIALDSLPNIIHRKDRSNSGGGLLIYSKNYISIIRKSELENNLDETIWVEIRSKGQSFFYYVTHIDLRVQILITGHD